MSILNRTHGTTLLCVLLAAGAASCKKSSTAPETPVPTTMVIVDGNGQNETVGAALGSSLVVQVNDQNGAAMDGVGVTFSVTAGGGSVSPTSATTNASGQASTDWMLGPTSGDQTVRASVTANSSISVDFTATAAPDVGVTLSKAGGDMQTGLLSNALPDPIEVLVADQYGNGVPGYSVTFAANDGGSVTPMDATTDNNGTASAVWTLGPGLGAQTATATASGLTGSPITFDAISTTLFLDAITPDPLVEGASATITGTGFDPTPGNNTVTIDGQTAAVTAATITSLTVTVPSYNCQPVRDVDISVQVAAETSNTLSQRLHPASLVNLTVGEQLVIADPTAFCLQFAPDATGGDSYLIGVSATAETNALMPFSLTAVEGANTVPPPLVADHSASAQPSRGPQLTPLEQDMLRRESAYRQTEARIREWERQNAQIPRHPAFFDAGPGRAAAAVPNVGDPLTFKVPNIEGDLCTEYATINTTVKKVGTHGIIVVDDANPTDDPFTDSDLQNAIDTFDNDIYQVLLDNFGAPSDIDVNSRVFMVLTIEVNKFSVGAAGFVSSSDLASCASSNGGEIFYGYVPDPSNTAGGPFAQTRANVVANLPALIAHEVTHTIQQSRRAQSGSGFVYMANWEAEGQADLAKELLGMAQRGDLVGQDYGQSKITDNGTSDALYAQRFSRLGRYFGWDLATGKVADAPHDCSLFGYTSNCESAYYYGASWSFHRWILDRFGPSYTGGVAQLEQDWIDAFPTQNGRDNVEALVGVSFEDLFVDWAAMLYADGRVSGLPAELQMTSWDLGDIYDNLFDASLSLQPVQQSYAAFTAANSVRGGSTYYTIVSAAGARGALGIRLRDGSDATLPTTVTPRYWVVRIQ
jgi:hypothetical protein